MWKIFLWTVIVLVGLTGRVWAGDGAGKGVEDEAAEIRRQASLERHKEEELQMMRLDLERLKIESETRKVRAEAGSPANDAAPSGGGSRPVRITLKSLVIIPGGARACVEADGRELTVTPGSVIGDRQVKNISSTGITWVESNGKEIFEALP